MVSSRGPSSSGAGKKAFVPGCQPLCSPAPSTRLDPALSRLCHPPPLPTHLFQADSSKLVMAGALTDPVDGAVFIFRNVTPEELEAFVAADPYVKAGLVPSWTVRPYMVVAGDCT
jgi:uncharacterized protein YciI